MNKSFYDLPDTTRFEIYGAIEALNCETGKSGRSGQLSVAVARGKFGEILQAMDKFGLKFVDSYYFPLGTDSPAMHLRHDSEKYGSTNCNWLFANFNVK